MPKGLQHKGIVRRNKMIYAAVKLFLENGYEKTTTAISDVIEGTSVTLTNNLNDLRLEGLKPGSNVTLTSSTGATLYTGTASGTSLTIPTSGMKGVAIVSVASENGTFRTKTIIR